MSSVKPPSVSPDSEVKSPSKRFKENKMKRVAEAAALESQL